MRRLAPGESTGYGRRFAVTEETWIGIVPVGYADGFRRDLTGTEVVVGDASRPGRGDRLDGRGGGPCPTGRRRGTPVTLVGDGSTLERHARVAGTIGYELACGIRTSSGPERPRGAG